jgi:alginate O-acetyltransferase complex protein AlgI
MNFFSPEFVGFFLIVLFLYFIVKENNQKIVLLLSSSLFIGTFSIFFLIYTYIFIFTNYLFAVLIEKSNQQPKIKRIICNTGILLNIGALVFFKYLSFILESIINITHLFNYSFPSIILAIITPIGISYYTFQGISYLLQIHRGIEHVERDIVIFSNYFLFFPKFLSGPIELSKNFIPQLKKFYSFNYINFTEGLRLILWGAFKKMVIADRLSMIVDGVYPNLHSSSGNLILLTFLIQPLHIYCDFSGYTDIALGIGRTFGFKLTNNFIRPFFSTSVTMFWQRWHISLSSWCNDFIFRRLSFKIRKWGIWATVFSLFITFIVIGLWHGPRWNFIILGLLQGIAINYEFFTKKTRLKLAGRFNTTFVRYLSSILTYLFFCFSLIFFYASNVSDASYFVSNLFRNIDLTSLNIIFLTRFDKIIVLLSVLILVVIEFRQEQGKNVFDEIGLWPRWIRTACYYIICILIMYFGSPYKEFVYMKF